jgi:hypothetical protein
MAVSVKTQMHGEAGAFVQEDVYSAGNGWHVDEERQLHVKKASGGNVAAYAAGCWLSVREVTLPQDS